MTHFANTDQLVIGEVYEQMDSMLGHIKDIVEQRDAILYDHIHKHVVKRWDNWNVPLHALAYVLTPKYYSPSRLELLKIAKTRFCSYYLTFMRLLKVREALASMVSSDSWQGLKDRVVSASDRHDFQDVEDTVLDGHFWTQVKYVL